MRDKREIKSIFLSVLVLLVFNLRVGYGIESNSYTPDDNTLVLLHFDEGKDNPKDSSKYGNEIVNDGAVWGKGKFGSCLSFDGEKALVKIENSESMSKIESGDITIEGWILTEELPEKAYIFISCWGSSKEASFQIQISPDARVRALIGDSTEAYSYYSTKYIEVNKWQHVAIAISPKKSIKFYFDEEMAGEASITHGINPISNNITIGYDVYYAYPPDIYFKGFIDEVRISNIARSFKTESKE